MKISSYLKQERQQRGWSAAFVASLLGVSTLLVEQWEQGVVSPSALLQERVCHLFEINPQTFQSLADISVPENVTPVAFLLQPEGKRRPERAPAGQEAVSWSQARPIYDPAAPRADQAGLIGRDALLTRMRHHLQIGSRLALHGLPGSGKTALAIALTHDEVIRERFRDGFLWVGLGRLPRQIELFSRWGAVLGINALDMKLVRNAEEWASVLRSVIGSSRFLLVIDDAWGIDDAVAFQIGGPQCGYVLTTRIHSLATSFAQEQTFVVSELTEGDGQALLARFAPALIAQDPATAQHLVKAVGALPLALTIMGKYLRLRSTGGTSRRLQAALEQLKSAEYRVHLMASVSPLEAAPYLSEQPLVSLQSVIAVSDQRLSVQAHLALCALSILPSKPDNFSQSVALAVTQADGKTLTALCDAGLLEQNEAGRYMLHQTIVDYARPQLRDPLVYKRFIQCIIDRLGMDESEEEDLGLATSMLALKYAFEQGYGSELIECTCLLAPLLIQRGFYPLAEQVLRRAYGLSFQSSQIRKVRIIFYLANVLQKQGEYRQAQQFYEEGLELAHRLEDEEQICYLLSGLGTLAKEHGEYGQAESWYQQALVLARRLDDQVQMCSLFLDLGVVARERGEYSQATHLAQEGLSLARHLNTAEQISTALRNLGILAREQGNFAQAEVFYQEALALIRPLELHDLMSNVLMNLGSLFQERGNYVQAEAFLNEGLLLARQMGYRERISVILSNLGVVAEARADYGRAEAYLQEGLSLARQIGHRERISLLLLNLGVIAERQGRYGQAEVLYQESLELAQQIGHRERISLLLLNLGDIALEQNDVVRAEAYLYKGLTLAYQIGHQERISDLLLHLALMATQQKQAYRAEVYLQEGLLLARQIGHPQRICALLAGWGDFFLLQQKPGDAERAFREMLALTPAGNLIIQANAWYGLAQVAMKQDECEVARNLALRSLAIFEAAGHRKAETVGLFLTTLPQETTR